LSVSFLFFFLLVVVWTQGLCLPSRYCNSWAMPTGLFDLDHKPPNYCSHIAGNDRGVPSCTAFIGWKGSLALLAGLKPQSTRITAITILSHQLRYIYNFFGYVKLSSMYFANMFSQLVTCLLIILTQSWKAQVFSFNKV
jgi:hypothetical protein